MKPNHTDRNVSTSGVSATGEFKISVEHSAHIMTILRDTLYSDKVLAVLREYSANAWDAHRDVDKFDVPIKVTLPTAMDPTLYIRDYGPGLSLDNMFAIYAQYGVSTKRGSDKSVGMLGIGSKSGFAYTDSFTVTSWHDGKMRIFTALLDNGEKGSMNLLAEMDCGEETGVQIQIPVRPQDIPEFVSKAEKLFQYFKPRPEINITLPAAPDEETLLKNGSISSGGGDWIAIMGCIPYRINLDQLRGLNAHNGGAGEFLNDLSGCLYFNIGEVQINASREELKYSDETKARLIDKFNDLVDEFVKHTLDKIDSEEFTDWEKRVRAQVLNDMGLPVPDALKKLTDKKVDIGEAKTFTLTYGPKQNAVTHIAVATGVRMVVRDEVKKLDGYSLGWYDYVVRPRVDIDPKPTLDEVRTELNEKIAAAGLTGVTMLDISSIPWHSKAKFNLSHKTVNKKHQVRTFVLKSFKYPTNPYSDLWDIEERTPSNNDVRVIIQNFKIWKEDSKYADVSFFHTVMRDRDFFKPLNVEMPRIYGYKRTEKDPITYDKLIGRSYEDWKQEALAILVSRDDVKPYLEALDWVSLTTRVHNHWSFYDTPRTVKRYVYFALFRDLGPDHPICQMIRMIMRANRLISRTSRETMDSIRKLYVALNSDHIDAKFDSKSQKYVEELNNRYPMFKVFTEGAKTILTSDKDDLKTWIEYLRLVDRDKKGLNNVASTAVYEVGRVDHRGLSGEAACREEGSSELPQPEEGNRGGELGLGAGSPVGTEHGEGVVQSEVRSNRDLRDLLRAASA